MFNLSFLIAFSVYRLNNTNGVIPFSIPIVTNAIGGIRVGAISLRQDVAPTSYRIDQSRRKLSTTRLKNAITGLLTCLLLCCTSLALGEQPPCVERNGIKICASFHGSSPLSSLVPGENVSMKVDIFYVHIENNSVDKLSVSSSDFSCIDTVGNAATVDEALSEKIKWPKRLAKTVLKPGQSVEGYLFCPRTKYPVRILTYQGKVLVELQMF